MNFLPDDVIVSIFCFSSPEDIVLRLSLVYVSFVFQLCFTFFSLFFYRCRRWHKLSHSPEFLSFFSSNIILFLLDYGKLYSLNLLKSKEVVIFLDGKEIFQQV